MPFRAGEYVDIVNKTGGMKWARPEGEPLGVSELVLHRHKDGSYTHLLRIRKGTELPGITKHDFYEEVYYIEGRMLNTSTSEKIEAGDYVFHEPNEGHGPFRCLSDCLILEFRYYKKS